jgi:hypothetical protein
MGRRSYQTTRGISASIASSIPFAATGGLAVRQCLFHALDITPEYSSYGTKIADALAPVSFTASRTVANTGFPKCVSPAFFGFVPPTTLVPALNYQLDGLVPCRVQIYLYRNR